EGGHAPHLRQPERRSHAERPAEGDEGREQAATQVEQEAPEGKRAATRRTGGAPTRPRRVAGPRSLRRQLNLKLPHESWRSLILRSLILRSVIHCHAPWLVTRQTTCITSRSRRTTACRGRSGGCTSITTAPCIPDPRTTPSWQSWK